ncbi:hypothetical protein BU26DRAFT_515217 [Trematosphaeria pertusa]|uniref:GCN5-related N-acetyltransferase Rv2170-like domain-containing protein n=1 Tax=Trematosphaeria pertusa TaxID=390896 RepID=A0A6A6IQD3_9PLEO|nr:uncharacterized protein BU26DRAFT_515217 [Trematosphaeria pertusa]KAF2252765.1 hypothetical protein BU26DRAFT_515217 [Trematosphaeria pertusa]
MPVYDHPATSPLLQQALQETLPHSINLVYRTTHANRTPDAHILATFSPSDKAAPKCWAVAYLDRSMRPETELWIFAAGEMPGHSGSGEAFCSTCTTAVLSLLDYMSALPVPPLHPENLPALELGKLHEKTYPETGPHVRYPPNPGAYMRHLLLPSVVVLGACHHQVVQVCESAGLLRMEFPGRDAELNKFLFRVSDLPQTRELPDGLRWGEMRAKDISMVQSRTSIPRATRTLLSLKSVGVFKNETDTPVAWAFLGLDGSLTTLHTEPEYRGNGIAKAVAAKIFRDYAPDVAVDEEGNAWAHADVYVGNSQSESVCRSLGGRAFTKIFWVRIDFARAGTLVRADAQELR